MKRKRKNHMVASKRRKITDLPKEVLERPIILGIVYNDDHLEYQKISGNKITKFKSYDEITRYIFADKTGARFALGRLTHKDKYIFKNGKKLTLRKKILSSMLNIYNAYITDSMANIKVTKIATDVGCVFDICVSDHELCFLHNLCMNFVGKYLIKDLSNIVAGYVI